jgi:perosamine synthetase
MDPRLDNETESAALEALRHDKYVGGENVYKFEEEFAGYIGTKHAVSTSSGTSALSLALTAMSLKEGEEVITTPLSFVATANSVMHAGGVPKFADINPVDYNIEPKEIGRGKSIPRIIMPVHLFGHPCQMDELGAIADSHGSVILEDACQAHGAKYKGRRVGSIGAGGCFSFYPSKNMTVFGDGGMFVTQDEELAKTVRMLRDHGRTSHYEHEIVGYTSRLNSMNAAMGRVQLRNLDRWNERRRMNAGAYDELLDGIEGLSLPPEPESGLEPVYHLYVIRTNSRDALKTWLEERGVQCGIHYPIPIHLQPAYRREFGYETGQFPATEEFCKTCLSIPVHQYLTTDDITIISDLIREFFKTGQ